MASLPDPPSGVVTFLFTDIEGSTALWDRYPDTMTDALAEHDRRIRRIVDARSGYVFTTAGDSFAVAFRSPADALSAGFEIQMAMLEPAGDLTLQVRAGVHTGTASHRDGDYFGPTVNRGARLAASAHGGQLVVSQSTIDSLGGMLPDEAELFDLGSHRLRGLAEPERIHQFCHPALQRDFPRLRTVEGPGDNLPTQLTSFVGRETEVAEITQLLIEHRLVTLSGAGGAGKTRLALRVADDLIGDFPDGLRFAELGALYDLDVLVDEIAQRFGVTAMPDVPLIRSVAETIGDQRILLVLDNCEQIVAHVASVCADLLTSCPQLHVLATSRERLGIAGEVLYRVPSLSLPSSEVTVDDSLRFDAVRLFAERAQLAAPDFEVTADTVADIVAICERLDGIPLAIELAAARTRSMSPAQIGERLNERFRLLTASDRIASERQRTLLSTIEWSHELLGDAERQLFRRLGVFAADFGLSAAERVCAGGDIDEFDVLDVMVALVDKSMVATEPGGDGTTRYVLLETLREFARRELERTGERHTLERRHAEFFADLAADLQAMHRRGELGGALQQLGQEEADFRSALRYSLGAAHFVVAGRLVSGLGYLWYTAGQHREGLQWCDALFDADPELPDDIRAGALHSYASMLAVMGQATLGIAVNTEQVELRRRLGDPVRLGAALNNLGDMLCDVGEFDAAEPILAESIELMRTAGGSPSFALCTLGMGQARRGAFDQGEQNLRDALAEARERDEPHAIAVAMGGLGEVLTVSGQYEVARASLVEARERFDELGIAPGILGADLYLGIVERGCGNRSKAASRFLSSLTGPGDQWSDEAGYWIMQLTASILDDRQTAAVLVGAASAGYERAGIQQSTFIRDDLDNVTADLERDLGPDEFGRNIRAGGRRTRSEAQAIAETALRTMLDDPTLPP